MAGIELSNYPGFCVELQNGKEAKNDKEKLEFISVRNSLCHITWTKPIRTFYSVSYLPG